MPKVFVFLLIASTLTGITGCSNSECRKVKELEAPAYNTLVQSENSLRYWAQRESSELASESVVCKDKLELNSKTLAFEKVGEVCSTQTGVVSALVSRSYESAKARYSKDFEEWKKIVKLYPNCFDPEKVVKANS